MSSSTIQPTTGSSANHSSRAYRLGQWIQDPMVSVIAASAATIGAFGIVIAGSWLIHLALN